MYSQIDEIKAAIEAGAPMSLEEIIASEVKGWLTSPVRALMVKAQSYYGASNDILKKERTVIGEGGRQVKAENIADNRIGHAFLRELVDQKVQYLLGKPWSVKVNKSESVEKLEEVFDEEFRALFRRVGKDAVNKGVAWLYVYPKGGKLEFYRLPPEEVLPLWTDADHTQLGGVIRVFERIEYQGKNKKTVIYVDYWSLEGVKNYVFESGKLALIGSGGMLTDDVGGVFNWEILPFIAVKYNDEETPLLQVIKPLIDEYDMSRSGDANLLQDQPNGIVVLKNYDGQDLGEFRRNLATYRAVKVTDMGGVEVLTATPDIAASIMHKEGLRRDIYGFGRGVDTQADMGANASAEARQYLYAQLDLDCNQLEQGVCRALKQLCWFVENYYGINCKGAQFTFNRDIIISESTAIDMCTKSQGLQGLSAQTILNNHPWVENAKEEMARFDRQQQEQMEQLEMESSWGNASKTGGKTDSKAQA